MRKRASRPQVVDLHLIVRRYGSGSAVARNPVGDHTLRYHWTNGPISGSRGWSQPRKIRRPEFNQPGADARHPQISLGLARLSLRHVAQAAARRDALGSEHGHAMIFGLFTADISAAIRMDGDAAGAGIRIPYDGFVIAGQRACDLLPDRYMRCADQGRQQLQRVSTPRCGASQRSLSPLRSFRPSRLEPRFAYRPTSPGLMRWRTPITARTSSLAWQALVAHHAGIKDVHLRRLLADDPGRAERLSTEGAGLFLDYSKNR